MAPISNTTGPEGKIYGPVHIDTSSAYSNIAYPSSGSGGGHRPVKNTTTKPAWQDTGRKSYVVNKHIQ